MKILDKNGNESEEGEFILFESVQDMRDFMLGQIKKPTKKIKQRFQNASEAELIRALKESMGFTMTKV